jgi:pimeloyl-ACP methyl ester carboxylesterase
MRRSSRIILAVVGIGVVLVGLTTVYQRVFGRTRLRFPYQSRPIPEATYTELATKPGWGKAQLEVAPGVKLNGLVRRPSAATAPWVLYYPGNDESQLERGQGFLSLLGATDDFGLAVFAYRGYDSSQGESKLADIRADAPQIARKFCELVGVPPTRLHLAGFSIGGHFAVHAARGVAAAGKPAKSLTLLAPVDDIVMYHASPWEKLSAGEDYQTRPFLAEVPGPVLVVQGSADSALAGPKQGHDIAQALGDKARYEELAGVDHVPLLKNEQAVRLVRDFVKAHAE